MQKGRKNVEIRTLKTGKESICAGSEGRRQKAEGTIYKSQEADGRIHGERRGIYGGGGGRTDVQSGGLRHFKAVGVCMRRQDGILGRQFNPGVGR